MSPTEIEKLARQMAEAAASMPIEKQRELVRRLKPLLTDPEAIEACARLEKKLDVLETLRNLKAMLDGEVEGPANTPDGSVH